MKNLTRLTIAAILATVGASTAFAEEMTYFSADYGFVQPVKTQTANPGTTLEYRGVTQVGGPMNFVAPSTKSTFFSLGMGEQFELSSWLNFRVGPEYNQLTTNYSGSSTYESVGDGSSGNYSYTNKTYAIFATGKLLAQPFKQIPVTVYFGTKLGVAINQTGNYSYQPSPSAETPIHTNYVANSNTTFAYGWNIGLEYSVIKRLAIHAGFEQLYLGTPSLIDGTWSAAGTSTGGTMTDPLSSGRLSVNLVNVGLTYLF